MLLTFEAYADIPEKIHVFYDQAFDVLFAKHDALKEAYKRTKYTPYPIDLFKRYFSYFCLLSYNRQKYSFSEGEVLELIRESAALVPADINETLFMKDLMESVCMLQWDGLSLVFTHRSFQEYFTAYCMARLPPATVVGLLRRFAARTSDNVLSMVFDINRDLVEDNYICPMFYNIEETLKRIVEEYSFESMCKSLKLTVQLSFHTFGRDDIVPMLTHSSELEFFYIVGVLYSGHFEAMRHRMIDYREMDRGGALKEFDRLVLNSSAIKKAKKGKRSTTILLYRSGIWQLGEEEKKDLLPWIEQRGFVAFWRDKLTESLRLWRELVEQRRERAESMERLLGGS